jgi:hypothetical protein
MTQLKTQPNDQKVEDYLNTVEPQQKRDDCFAILKLMQEVTGEPAKMWGSSIVGFGQYHYKYESGREGNWFVTGFASRSKNITLYIMAGFENYDELMHKLGKHTTGKSCLYIKKLEDVDQAILRELVKQSVAFMVETYPS